MATPKKQAAAPTRWDAYSVGEKVDLDNDGEKELIISGHYGGIYFDARDNKVYEFAAEMNFGEEPVDPNNSEFGMKYTWNGTEISYNEYTALCSKIFAAEVSTN